MIQGILSFRNKNKAKIFLITIVLMIGCRNINPGNGDVSYNSDILYDIEIDYNSIPFDDERSLAGGDTVAIGFVGKFAKDTVDVFKNNKFYKTTILTSDTKTDGAGHLILDKYHLLDNVGIRINGGPLIFIETGRRDYHINLAYYNDQVNVKFYKYLPATY